MSGYGFEFNREFPVGMTPEFTCEWLLEDGSLGGTDFPWAEYGVTYSVLSGDSPLLTLTLGPSIVVDALSNTITFTLPGGLCGEYRHTCFLTHIATARTIPVFDGDLIFSTEAGL